jgi:hypothetical protein
MSTFGDTLFGGTALVRWALTPCVLIFGIAMPFLIPEWTPPRVAMMLVIELVCLALLGGFWLPARVGHWCFRAVSGVVFMMYAAYLIDQLLFANKPIGVAGGRGAASPINAVVGFVMIGLPSLWFALLGRFRIFRDQVSLEGSAAERQATEALILQPNWEFYERHLERSAPAALRTLYADRKLVTRCALAYASGVGINTFVPLDERGLLDTCELLGYGIVPFALSDCGDPIYLRPGATEPDIVYITYHDGGDTEVLAESVDAMLVELRLANGDG